MVRPMPGGQPPRVNALLSDQMPSGSKPSTTSSPSPASTRVASRSTSCRSGANSSVCGRRRTSTLSAWSASAAGSATSATPSAAWPATSAARRVRARARKLPASPQAPTCTQWSPKAHSSEAPTTARSSSMSMLPSGPSSQDSRFASGAMETGYPRAARAGQLHSRMLDVRPIAAFRDNYMWMIRGARDPRAVAVVDPGDAAPVMAVLAAEGLRLEAILATHHHADHVGGVVELVAATGARAFGPARERMPVSVERMAGGAAARVESLGLEFDVIDVPGHTAGHVAYTGHGALFCGDTLFSAGCGRLFEGTADQMLASLDALAALPEGTRVYCGHEYTEANLRFAMAVEAGNSAIMDYVKRAAAERAAGNPTLPSTIGLEKRVNPFLRSRHEDVKSA